MTRDQEIETLARMLCTLDNRDPDQMVMQAVHSEKLGWSVRDAPYWQLRADEAERRLDASKVVAPPKQT